MIDRSQRILFFRVEWLRISAAVLGAAIFMDAMIAGGVAWASLLAFAATIIPPVAMLLLLGSLKVQVFLNRSMFRISYTCPHCARQDLPCFICPNPNCGEILEDLEPSLFGVLFAKCDQCKEPLPTSSWSGRSSLKKVCRHCSFDLRHSDLGTQPEYRIALVGAASSGKTNVLYTALWQVNEHFAPNNGVDVSFGNPEEKRAFQSAVAQLKDGRVMEKTLTRPIPRAFTLSLTSEDCSGCLLYLYDAAGEDFEDEHRLAAHPLQWHDGIWFIVDPFAESGIREVLWGVGEDEISKANPAPVDAAEILARLISSLERIHKTRVGEMFPVPIAVTITKADACGLNKHLRIPSGLAHHKYFSMAFVANSAEACSAQVRRFLFQIGMGNFVRIVESRFPRVMYSAVSALSPPKDNIGGSAFEPQGVEAPLLWLCYHTSALCDTDSFDRSFVNWNMHLMRILRGREGHRAQLMSWLILAGIALVILFIFMLVDIATILLCGGIHFVAFVVFYMVCYRVLIRNRFRD